MKAALARSRRSAEAHGPKPEQLWVDPGRRFGPVRSTTTLPGFAMARLPPGTWIAYGSHAEGARARRVESIRHKVLDHARQAVQMVGMLETDRSSNRGRAYWRVSMHSRSQGCSEQRCVILEASSRTSLYRQPLCRRVGNAEASAAQGAVQFDCIARDRVGEPGAALNPQPDGGWALVDTCSPDGQEAYVDAQSVARVDVVVGDPSVQSNSAVELVTSGCMPAWVSLVTQRTGTSSRTRSASTAVPSHPFPRAIGSVTSIRCPTDEGAA